jgi:predicted MFS family arabinose efflux permease
VFFVNPPVCVILLAAAFRLISGEHRRAPLANFDSAGAVLVTAAMLLLVYGLVRAPDVGWGKAKTIAELAGAAVLFVLFVINEQRHHNPLVPLSIFRIKGLAAADVTQVIAVAGFFSMFFFITLYMQNVLDYSPTKAGAAFIPITLGAATSSVVCSKVFERTGTRPLIVGGALLAAGGVYWLSRIPVQGSFLNDLLPGFLIMSVGLGAVFTGVQTAANAGVPPDKAGLAAALVNASFQVGGALGLAIFSAIATSHTRHLLTEHVPLSDALTSGFRWALTASSIFLVAAAVIALRTTNTRGEPMPAAGEEGVTLDAEPTSLPISQVA